MTKIKKIRKAASIGLAVLLLMVTAFSVQAYAISVTHDNVFYSGTSSHTITLNVNYVKGEAKASSLSLAEYYLTVNGTAFSSLGSGCGGYYQQAHVNPGSAIEAKSAPGYCTGIPCTATGYANLQPAAGSNMGIDPISVTLSKLAE